ncbi:AraC family transcriptional regulator [Dictyobacter aurantiacus]|uniref:HTH araC/xylS-type domain-containing protein n=1 Tax=Dictyobacter aurantiacus TaxID=1936993 RepID=A0A401ZNY8_9CHLR|nr:AraC family transcriptional regulator [Dictyobacter aurantiacus]GCE08585.1 hypothetical protein KDAU_59140 [Dictyobacter aurantiacus]
MADTIHIRLLNYQVLMLKPARWRLPRVQSHFWRFYMNDRDGAQLDFQGTPYPLLGEQLYVIPAEVRFSTQLAHTLRHFFVHFDVLGLSPIIYREIFATPICLPASLPLKQMVHSCIEEMRTGQPEELVLEFRLKAILYTGLTQYLQQIEPATLRRYFQLTSALEPVRPAIEYVDAHLSEPLLCKDLASLCHMNVDYFSRRFRECVGQTPNAYIQLQRIKRAEQQLLLTDDSIEQIAAHQGFGSRHYFSRIFARHTGVSPAAYRKGLLGS